MLNLVLAINFTFNVSLHPYEQNFIIEISILVSGDKKCFLSSYIKLLKHKFDFFVYLYFTALSKI